MALISDGIVRPGSGSFGNTTAATLNLAYGGQMGYMPRLGLLGPDGKPMAEYINATPYVKRDIIPVLLSGPSAANLLPKGQEFLKYLKALIEEQANSIEGLDRTISVATESRNVGRVEKLYVPTNVTHEVSSPAYSWTDVSNRSIQLFWSYYISMLIGDAESYVGKPLISSFLSDDDLDSFGYLLDRYSFTVLHIEPDITQRRVVNSWLCINMFPEGAGDETGRRNITEGGELNTFTLTMHPITLIGAKVNALGQRCLDSMDVLKKVPDLDLTLPNDGIDPNISDLTGVGFNR
jgi:hypothetical protein